MYSSQAAIRIEARVKAPYVQGSWPAFWMQPDPATPYKGWCMRCGRGWTGRAGKCNMAGRERKENGQEGRRTRKGERQTQQLSGVTLEQGDKHPLPSPPGIHRLALNPVPLHKPFHTRAGQHAAAALPTWRF